MIHLVTRRLRPEHHDRVVAWLAEVGGPRRAEALASLEAEGVAHELAVVIETSDGPILVYAMETDDLDAAQQVSGASDRPIDEQHRVVMRAADAGRAESRVVLDLHPEVRDLG